MAEYLKRLPEMEGLYLEHVVGVLGVAERSFHVKLSALYLQAVLKLLPQYPSEKLWEQEQLFGKEVTAPLGRQRTRQTMVAVADMEDPMLKARKKLLQFLRTSEHYDPTPILQYIEGASPLSHKV